MIYRLLFKGDININRRSYLWNLISSVTFSIQSALFLWLVTKISGATDAGAFIILYTVAQTLNSLGNYSIRDFQVSDIRDEFSFKTYYTARWVTCLSMLFLATIYCYYKKLDPTRSIVLICLVGYRFIECIEDVYHGHIQSKGRFDITSICMSIRIVISSAAFCISYIATGNQIIASAVLLLAALLVYKSLLNTVKREFKNLQPSFSFSFVPKLLATCFPVFVGAFLYTYLINAPKYAIDNLLNQEIQTVFNILFMPIFVINILSMFVYKPQLVQMSQLWNGHDIRHFYKQMIKQTLTVVFLTIIVMIGGGLIGLHILELIYGLPLMTYRNLFVILLGFGGIAAIAYYFNALIVIIRKQRFILIGYLSALLISIVFTDRLVYSYNIEGAGFAYGLIMTFLMVFYLIVIILTMARVKHVN